jgi:hypothetical protein
MAALGSPSHNQFSATGHPVPLVPTAHPAVATP